MPKRSTKKTDVAALSGAVMVDSYLGVLRLRKWPRKRGPVKSVQQQIQVDRFTAAQGLAKRAPGAIQADWIKATVGTDFYPRDIGTKMILNGPFEIELPDGTIQRPGRRELFAVTFQGFEARLTANQALTSSTNNFLTWPTPIRDTAGFFDPAATDRITIPEGVTVMNLSAGWRRSTLTSGFLLAQMINRTLSDLVVADGAQTGGGGTAISTGPLAVVPGHQYSFAIYPQSSGTVLSGRTFFSGHVLEAEPL